MVNGSNLRVASTPDSRPRGLLPKGVKRVTKVTFVYVKRVKAKTGVTSHLSVPEYGMTNERNCLCVALPLTATPKRGNKTYPRG